MVSSRLFEVLLVSPIPLGEVAHDQPTSARLFGQTSGLIGRQMSIFTGEIGVSRQEGRLTHEKVDAAGQRHRSVAPARVHDEGHRLTPAALGHILDPHLAGSRREPPFTQELTNLRP
jgi:hypothetical protein